MAVLSYATQAATISWVPDADGNWEVASNWDLGVPGSSDDAVIDVGGDTVRTITIGSGGQSVNSVTSEENLYITGGDLTVGAGTSEIDADLVVGSGRSLVVDGGAFTASGEATIGSANFYVYSGGALDLSSADSYSGSTLRNIIRVDGDGSLLDLSGLSSFRGGSGGGLQRVEDNSPGRWDGRLEQRDDCFPQYSLSSDRH